MENAAAVPQIFGIVGSFRGDINNPQDMGTGKLSAVYTFSGEILNMTEPVPNMHNMNDHSRSIPHLRKIQKSQQLIVDGKPFLMLGAELQNSSLSSAAYMKTVWQKLVDTNINTVLGSVTWEDIEPTEGKFDFSELDQIIEDARAFGLRLVLLWFGSFKNGTFISRPCLQASSDDL